MDVFTANPKKVGKNIGRIRKARGAKQVDVARALGVSQEHMSNIGSIIFSVEFGFENTMVVRTNQTH
jgi:hypothetical protein